eukprot:scaffold327250_cov71-Tisochrysis_lutea.AAC.1
MNAAMRITMHTVIRDACSIVQSHADLPVVHTQQSVQHSTQPCMQCAQQCARPCAHSDARSN